MSDYAPYEDADDCIAALRKERDELLEALTDMSANSDHFAEQLFLRTRERDELRVALTGLLSAIGPRPGLILVEPVEIARRALANTEKET